MKTEEILTPEAQGLVDAINAYSTQKFLAKIPLEQHSVFTNLQQNLVIKGINAQPDVDYVHINVCREFVNADGKVVRAGEVCPEWKINAQGTTFVITPDGKPLTYIEKKIAEQEDVDANDLNKDQEGWQEIKVGDVISETEKNVRVNTINYLLFLYVGQKAELVNLLVNYAKTEYIPMNQEFLLNN